MSVVVHLRDVTVRRGTKNILDAVTWEVHEADRWVILGPNGAGKTTLLQVAAARLHPSSGTADLLGRRLGRVDVFELRPRLGIASAALAEAIPGHETVRNLVITAAWGVTGRWRESYEHIDSDRADALLALFGIAHLANRTFGTLSEGERKRAQIARALMSDPEILLLDEPAAGLDLGGREQLLAALAELAGDRASPVLILVTHHVEEIPPGFTHLMLMRDGAARVAGPLAEALTSDNLTATFDLPLVVMPAPGGHGAGRWVARAA